MNKTGYKQTSLGWIPEEWEMKELKNITCKPIVYGIVQGGAHVPDGVPYIKSSDVGGDINIDNLSRASLTIENKYKRSRVEPGDIVFSLRGNIGELSVVPEGLKHANLTQGTARISVSKEAVNYLKYALSAPILKRIIKVKAKGSTFQEISLEQLRQLPIPLPTPPERRRIASILSTWDDAIAKEQQLIEALKIRHRALMQQLLSGKKRLKGFKGEWKEVHLGDVFTERNEIGCNDLPLLSITADRGVIYQSQNDKKNTSNEDKSKYRRICIGDIGYNTMRMWQGRSALSELEGIVSPAYTIITPNKDQLAAFYAALFKVPFIINSFFCHSQGLVEDTLNCKYKDFAIVKVRVPKIGEQTAIATILNTSKKEIQIHLRHLVALQQQKKGLMQVLLTGKVRVKMKEL